MGAISFSPLEIKRLSEVIEDRIKERILCGELKPGDRLPTEKALAKQFGVSSVTIREALRGLQAFGFIGKKKGRGGGIFVTHVNIDSLKVPLHNFLSLRRFSPRSNATTPVWFTWAMTRCTIGGQRGPTLRSALWRLTITQCDSSVIAIMKTAWLSRSWPNVLRHGAPRSSASTSAASLAIPFSRSFHARNWLPWPSPYPRGRARSG